MKLLLILVIGLVASVGLPAIVLTLALVIRSFQGQDKL